MSKRYSLINFTESYETFGRASELQQVIMVRQSRKVREVVRANVHEHFDHESLWTDGRNYFVLLEPYNEEDPERTPNLACIRIPLAIAPYHQSRPKPKGFKPPMGAWLFGLPETKSVLDEIQGELEVSARYGLYGL